MSTVHPHSDTHDTHARLPVPQGDGLLATRPAAAYNQAEQEFSVLLFRRLEQLLKGERNALLLLRRYPDDPSRVGVMPTPAGIDRDALRAEVVEPMVVDAVAFLCAQSAGGPVAQLAGDDGRLVERREFATRYPHIVVHREDVYEGPAALPRSIEWCARRVQNQRRNTTVNQLLDIAGLGVELVKYLAR